MGNRLVLLGESHAYWVLAFYGILLRCVAAVPLNPAASLDALTAFLKGSATKWAFVAYATASWDYSKKSRAPRVPLEARLDVFSEALLAAGTDRLVACLAQGYQAGNLASY